MKSPHAFSGVSTASTPPAPAPHRRTGRGLSIVEHVLQRHDILLAIGSVLGRGACFTATFPAYRLRAG
ncbi:MAG: hypothetical protein LBK55_05080 [Azoarcus sp.]|nr:hypothetical protein [Azoarcus sp.]